MTAPTLGGVALGNVESISFTKDSNIIPISIPGSDSDGTETFDLLGVTKTITVTGTFTATSAASLKSLVDAVSALVDGAQTSSVSFVSDEMGTVSVKISSFDVGFELTFHSARYTLRMIEGS